MNGCIHVRNGLMSNEKLLNCGGILELRFSRSRTLGVEVHDEFIDYRRKISILGRVLLKAGACSCSHVARNTDIS